MRLPPSHNTNALIRIVNTFYCGVVVPAAVCRWGLCPRGPGVARCLSGVYLSSSCSNRTATADRCLMCVAPPHVYLPRVNVNPTPPNSLDARLFS